MNRKSVRLEDANRRRAHMSLIIGSNTSPFNASQFQENEVERVAEEYKKIQAQLAEIERAKQQTQLLDVQASQNRKKSTITGLFKKLRSKTTSSNSLHSLSTSPSQANLINFSGTTSPLSSTPSRKSAKLLSIFPSHNEDDSDIVEIAHSRSQKSDTASNGAVSLIQRVEKVTVEETTPTQFEFDEAQHFDPLEVQQINEMLNQYAYQDDEEPQDQNRQRSLLESSDEEDDEEGQHMSKSLDNASSNSLKALKKYKQEAFTANSSISTPFTTGSANASGNSLSSLSTSPQSNLPSSSHLDRMRSFSLKMDDTDKSRKSFFKKKPVSNEVVQQLATTNSILKEAYSKKNSHNVILLERKRYQESGCFSPKIILSKLKQENKLSQQFLMVDHYFEKNKPINFI